MFLFNSLTRQKELFTPLHNNRVTLYTCGPTVYDFAHIGNFRTYVFEDILRRTLRFFGFDLIQAMNLTDVDDKTIRGAIRQKSSLDAYTKPFKEAFFQDLQTLHIEPVEYYPEATTYISEMIKIIEVLLKNGFAYRASDGSLYFAIKQFPSYGALCHLCKQELQPGVRINNDEYDKEHVSDFVLWKAYDPERDGQIYWDSPFGKGRPGWHIECSAMAMKLLGEEIDIHVGGVDNLFPHHENEIAQSEGCTGKTFVRYWLHAEHLLVDHKKMSKSLGNFYTLRDLLQKGFQGLHVRYLLMQTHYRTQLNFTLEGLQAAKASLERLHAFIERMQGNFPAENRISEVKELLQNSRHRFENALRDDCNMPQALATLFDLVKQVNSWCDQGHWSAHDAKLTLSWLQECDRVLGCLFVHKEAIIPHEVVALLEERQAARTAREWGKADLYRQKIAESGYEIEDTPQGPRLKAR